tara:strand:- start:201 stop:374 length:174 start_codon:yes stop_codon:yes gene_type:complete
MEFINKLKKAREGSLPQVIKHQKNQNKKNLKVEKKDPCPPGFKYNPQRGTCVQIRPK